MICSSCYQVFLIGLNFYIKQFFYLYQQPYIISTRSSLFLIIFIATYLYKRRETLDTFKTLGGAVLFLGAPMVLILAQPDLSTTIVIAVTMVAILFLSGINHKIVTAVIVIAIPVFCIFGYFFGNAILIIFNREKFVLKTTI